MDRIEKNSTKSSNFRYSEDFKNNVCREYLNGSNSKRSIEQKYKLGNGRLFYWMQELGYIASKSIKVFMSNDPNLSEELTPEQKRIRELEKELENARLQAEAYRLMIEVAERELQIKIRKK